LHMHCPHEGNFFFKIALIEIQNLLLKFNKILIVNDVAKDLILKDK
jgi:bifunctional pyridoxal-dependent enzyme with beta-cystathionase and maltose regulon repressor activities